MLKSKASLSLDLDNLWSYLRSYGDPRWSDYPSFLPIAVPRILRLLDDMQVRATIFIVGRDAENSENDAALRLLVGAGHEIGNHSYDHSPDFHRFSAAAVQRDLERAEAAIVALGAATPRGFRAPSFQLSNEALLTLSQRSYQYDASTFPTFLGPVLRAWQRAFFDLTAKDKSEQKGHFGGLSAGLRPLVPYRWQWQHESIIEIPVSTMPFLRLPIHWTYVHFIGAVSPRLATAYVRLNIALCRVVRLQPSLLLHATDFIGADDAECPRFLPGMKRDAAAKIELLRHTLMLYAQAYELVPIGDFVDSCVTAAALRPRVPDFTLRAQ